MDEAGFDVEREGVEALTFGTSETDRGECPPRVLPEVREGGQVPGDHAQPGGVGGVDEAAERSWPHEVGPLLVVARLQVEGPYSVPGHRRHLPPRVGPERGRVDIEPGPEARVDRAVARG